MRELTAFNLATAAPMGVNSSAPSGHFRTLGLLTGNVTVETDAHLTVVNVGDQLTVLEYLGTEEAVVIWEMKVFME